MDNIINDKLSSITFYIAACFGTALMGIVIRHLSDMGVHPFVMVMFRNIISFIIIFPWLMRKGIKIVKTERIGLHLSRAFTGFMGMVFLFQAIIYLPLTNVVSLSFTVPLFTTIAAVIFLKEIVGIRRWMAILVGFLGMIVIIRPDSGIIDPKSLLVIAAAISWSFSNIIVKKLTSTEKPMVIVFYMTCGIIPMSIPLAIPYFEMPNIEQFFFLIILSITSTLAQYSLSKSYSKADISFLQPFDFSRLIFTSIMAYFFFSEIITLNTIVGAIIIMSSSIYITKRESMNKKESQL